MTRIPARAAIAALSLMAMVLGEAAAAGPVDTVDASAVPAEAIKVEIDKMKYVTPNIEITAGSTIVWTNRDPVPHNVQLATPVALVGDMLRAGQSIALRFNEPGEYVYICTPHPFMKGKVTVKPKT